MVIYQLLLLLIILFFVFYIILGNDIFAPAVLTIGSFVFSVLCACYNIKLWDIRTDYRTMLIIITGLLVLGLANLIVKFQFRKKLRRFEKNKNLRAQLLQPIKVPKTNVYLIFIYDIIVLLLYFINVRRIGGGGSFISMMYRFRLATAYGGASISPIINMLVRVTTASSIVFIYYFVHNVYSGLSISSQLYILFPIVPDLLRGILGGGRFRLLQIIIEPVMVIAFLYFIKEGHSIHINIKTIAKALIIGIAAVLGFYYIKELVGRSTQKDLMTYVTQYFGGPIELFDSVVRGDARIRPTIIWGRNTFDSFYKYFVKYLGVNIGQASNPGFVISRTGINLGNVYTCFFPYFIDFGYTGVLICSFIGGIVWSYLYYKALVSRTRYIKMAYAYLSHAVMLQFYAEMTFGTFLSMDVWLILVFVYFLQKKWVVRSSRISMTINNKYQ